MRSAVLLHLVLFVLANAALVVLNLAPVGFDLSRPDVPLWFLWILVPWSALLLGHALLAAFRREPAPAHAAGAGAEEPIRAVRTAPVDPAQAGLAGKLLADCRREAGQVLSAVGTAGGVPVDLDDLLRGAVDQAERLAERLQPLYQARQAGKSGAVEQVGRLEDLLEELERALKALRLEAQVLAEGADPMRALANPLEALREAIMGAAEALAG
ncbi:MAG: hypothetical protein ABIO70_23890 [Pseudomonadota bacterium]